MSRKAVPGSEQIRDYLERARTEIEVCVTLEDALDRVLTISVEALRAAHGAITLRNLETRHLEIHPRREPDVDLQEKRRRYFERGEGIAGRAAVTGKPYRWNGDLEDPYFVPSPSGRTVYPLLAAPIIAHSNVTGVICIEEPERGFFTAEDEELLSRLAEQAALVIERSRFLETLIQLGQSVIGVPLGEMLRRMARQVSAWLDKSICTIDLWDKRGGELHVEACSEESDCRGLDAPLRLSAPLVSLQEGVVGTVRIYSPDEFSPWQQSLFNAFVKHANVAIENARLLEKNRKYLNILETLHTMTETVTQVLQRQGEDAVLSMIAQYSSQVLGTDLLTIYPYRQDKGSFEIPPICLGEIRYPEYLGHRIYPDDIPTRILEATEKYHYWRRAGQSEFLVGEAGQRDKDEPPRERFIIREEIASSAAVGLAVGDKPVGVVFFNFRKPQDFDSEQRRVIEAFANYMALALETLASHRQIRQSASQEEAERWDRELHDSVIQVLAGGVLAKAGVIKNQLRRKDYDKAVINLERLEKAAQYVYNEVQGIRAELADRRLAREGLLSALQDYIVLIKEQHHVEPTEDKGPSDRFDIEFEHDDLGTLPQETEHNLYRIAQEALSNALKSAHANRVRVSLHKNPEGIVLIVEDNGRGFDVKATLPQSFGLIGMRTRARAIGGHLAIESQPGAGTRITAVVPSNDKE